MSPECFVTYLTRKDPVFLEPATRLERVTC
jgi:hypothetical protein